MKYREKIILILTLTITVIGILSYSLKEYLILRKRLDNILHEEFNYNLKKLNEKDLNHISFDYRLKYFAAQREQIVTENSNRQTFFSTLGGVFVFVTAYISWANLELNKEINKTKQIAERFNKAVDLLIHTKTQAHMGGIYILGEIAEEDNSYYIPVMEMLTAYLREYTPLENISKVNLENSDFLYRANIQAVLKVFSKHSEINRDKYKHNLSKIDLQGIQIGGNWNDTDFSGANLTRTNFAFVKLKGSIFRGANLKNTIFDQAELNNVDFKGAENLTNEQLDKAKLSKDIIKPDYLQSSNSNKNIPYYQIFGRIKNN